MMKAATYFLTLALTVQLILPVFAIAQHNMAYEAPRNNEGSVEPDIATKVPVVKLDTQNQTASLNYTMPAFTYSASLLIRDFTGRTLRTIQLNPHSKATVEFPVNDLLTGTYTCTVLLDNREKVSGEFTIND